MHCFKMKGSEVFSSLFFSVFSSKPLLRSPVIPQRRCFLASFLEWDEKDCWLVFVITRDYLIESDGQ